MRIYHEVDASGSRRSKPKSADRFALREGQRADRPGRLWQAGARHAACRPVRWCERAFNVAHWTEFPEGGHFPAMEVPELLLDELRAFFA